MIRGLLKAVVIAGPFGLAAGCTDESGRIDPVRTGLAVGASALVIGALDDNNNDNDRGHRNRDWDRDRDHRRNDGWGRPRYVERHYCGDGHRHSECRPRNDYYYGW